MDSPLLVVTVTPRGGPAVTRYVCRKCRQYTQPMRAETAVWHLCRRHGYGQLGAEVAVRLAESEYETAEAERRGSRALLDVLQGD